jgi:hypothetical protein
MTLGFADFIRVPWPAARMMQARALMVSAKNFRQIAFDLRYPAPESRQNDDL